MGMQNGVEPALAAKQIAHRALSAEIHALSGSPAVNSLVVVDKKKQRLWLKDKIVREGGTTLKSK